MQTAPKWLRPIEISVGLVLILSAAIKGFELSLFMTQIAGYRLLPVGMEGAVAAAIVIFESALGFALITGFERRGVPHVATILLLAVFSGVFIYGMIARGVRECGCFGDFLELPPPATLAKNLVLIGMLAAAYIARRRLPPLKITKHSFMAASILGFAAIVCFVVGVRQHITQEAAKQAAVSGAIDPERPYAQFVFGADGRAFDLGKGEYLVVWLSTSCPECKKAIKPLGELKQIIPNLPPVVGLCVGTRSQLDKFRAETNPSFATVLVPTRVFMEYVEVDPPRYVLIRDGQVAAQWDKELPPAALAEKLSGI